MPLLRISLLQLEMVDRVVQDGTAVQPTSMLSNKIVDEADADTIAARRVSISHALYKSGSRYTICVLCSLAATVGQERGKSRPPHTELTHKPTETAAL